MWPRWWANKSWALMKGVFHLFVCWNNGRIQMNGSEQSSAYRGLTAIFCNELNEHSRDVDAGVLIGFCEIPITHLHLKICGDRRYKWNQSTFHYSTSALFCLNGKARSASFHHWLKGLWMIHFILKIHTKRWIRKTFEYAWLGWKLS